MTYSCPVCMFERLPYRPAEYHICMCCGTEFGNDDAELSHDQLREMWVADGAFWFFGNPPANWNPWKQLIGGWQLASVPFAVKLEAAAADTRIDPTLKLEENYSISFS
jgi:hypothetical protein